MIVLYALLGFAVVLLVFMYFFPAQTEDKIAWDKEEEIVFRSDFFEIVSRPRPGKARTYPGAQLLCSNKRVVLLQKTLWGGKLIVVEGYALADNPPAEWAEKRVWGNVPLYQLYADSILQTGTHTFEIRPFGGLVEHTLHLEKVAEPAQFAQQLAQWREALAN